MGNKWVTVLMHALRTPCVIALLLAILLSTLVSPAMAQGGASLAVSPIIAEVDADPGSEADVTFRVGNNTGDELTVAVYHRLLTLHDDGGVSYGGGPDPVWGNWISIAEPVVVVPPMSYKAVNVKVAVPANTRPDNYLLGFLFTPQRSTSAAVINQIGAILNLNVKGDRNRKVEVIGFQLPRLVIGSRLEGVVQVKNIGPSFAKVWGEVNVVNTMSGQRVANIWLTDKVSIASGLSREVAFTWQTPGISLPAKYRVSCVIHYNQTDATTADSIAQTEVWLVHPFYLAGITLFLALVIVSSLVWRGMHRHRVM